MTIVGKTEDKNDSSHSDDSKESSGDTPVSATEEQNLADLNSGSSDDAFIRTSGWMTLQKDDKIPRRKKRKTHSEYMTMRQQDFTEKHPDTSITKSPDLIRLEGSLAKCTFEKYNRYMQKCVNMFKACDSKNSWFTLLQNSLKKISENKEDVGTVSIIKGYYFVTLPEKKIKEGKQLLRTVSTCEAINHNIITAFMQGYLSTVYLMNNKLAKAHSAMKAAHMSIQNHQPGDWTSQIYNLRGKLYDILAHLTPSARRKYQQIALTSVITAREHCMSEADEGKTPVFYPVDFTLDIVYRKLDVPMIFSLSYFRDSHILYEYIKMCKIGQIELSEVESLIATITEHSKMISNDWYKPALERIVVANIILCIRQAQVSVQAKEIRQAWVLKQQALCTWQDWCLGYEADKSSYINRLPDIKTSTKQVIDELNDELTLLCDIQRVLRHQECRISPSPTSSSDPEQGAAVDDDLFAEMSLKDRNSKVEKDSDAL